MGNDERTASCWVEEDGMNEMYSMGGRWTSTYRRKDSNRHQWWKDLL